MNPTAIKRIPGADDDPSGAKTVVSASFQPPEPARAEGWRGGEGYDFEPKVDVLKRHLATRKHRFDLAHVTFPGLFGEQAGGASTRSVGGDFGWFKVAVVAEIITAAILSIIVVNVFGLPIYAGLLPLFGILGIDGLLAFLHHRPAANGCLRENQELLVVRDLRSGGWGASHETYKNFRDAVRYKIPPWQQWLPTLCAALIILVAVGKTFFLAANIQEMGSLFRPAADGNVFASHSSFDDLLQRGEYRGAVLIIFGLLYCLVAYIHIYHTGYALAEMWLVRGLKRDWTEMNQSFDKRKEFLCKRQPQKVNLRRFAEQLGETKDDAYTSRVPNGTEFQRVLDAGLLAQPHLSAEQQAAIAPHEISAEADGETYTLHRVGVLTDRQLREWVNMQPTDFAQLAVACYGHTLQLQLIGGLDIEK